MVEDRSSGSAEYAKASLNCDIVMKGGITSGVVYPRAVCELARTFRFRNVGGTSAGAIAAAATAAAEYGRAKRGFERLEKLPDWIGRGGNLTSLFQPQRSTKGLFKIVLAGIEHGAPWAIAVAIFRHLPAVVLGALPGIALVLLAGRGAGALMWVAYGAGALLALLGAALVLLLYLAAKLLWAVPANDYGLCSGWTRAFEEDEGSGPAPLTPWLHRKINEYADLPDEEPLTFGHLWAGPDGDRARPPKDDERYMQLAMMTTNLTNRRAHRLPLQYDEGEEWYFCPAEFRELFPEQVVAWMEAHSSAPGVEVDGSSLRPLPDAVDMPVIVAARLSLSFPVLLSAVPLWRREKDRKAERCWFSDGGISSNFPIHFFDRLVPRWPTFGINLRPFRGDEVESDDQMKNTSMVKCEEEEIRDWWYRIPEGPNWNPIKERRLLEFLSSIGHTMQNRIDEAQIRVPGYRDRVAHVSLSEKEGGMNLAMDPKVIEKLTERGRCAAERLSTAYTRAAAMDGITWDSHRWTRLRSTLAVLEEMHVRFGDGYEGEVQPPGAPTYAELVERGALDPPADYRWEDADQKELALAQIAAINGALPGAAAKGAVAAGAPKPPPEGRIEPRS